MKKLMIMLLCLSALASGATLQWISTASTNGNLVGNYIDKATGSAPASIGVNDSLTYYDSAGITEVSPTLTGALACGSIYMGNASWNDGGFATTLTGSLNWASAGTLLLTGDLTLSANGFITIGNSGTITTTTSDWILLGNNTVTQNKYPGYLKSLSCSYPGKTTTFMPGTGGGLYIIGPTTPLLFNGGAFVNNDQAIILYPKATGNIDIFSGTCTSFTGIGNFTMGTGDNAATYIISIPTLTITQGAVSIVHQKARENQQISLSGNLNVTGDLRIYQGVTTTYSFNTNNFNVTASGLLTLGCSNATGVFATNWGSSIVSIGSMHQVAYNSGTQTYNMGSSQWSDTGNWTWGNNAGTTVVPGTFTMTMSGVAAQTITSNGKHFYDVTDTGSAGVVDSLADIRYIEHNYTHHKGKQKFGGHNDTCGGNWTLSTLCSDTTFAKLQSCYLVMTGADPLLTWQSTGKYLFDSLTVQPQHSLTMIRDSANTILAFSPVRQTAGQRWTMQAGTGTKLTLATAADYTWSGTGTTRDTLKSSTPGTYARIGLPAAKTDSLLRITDIAVQGYQLICTTNSSNGGHDSGVVFQTSIAPIRNYLTPSQPVAGTVSPTSGPIGTTVTLSSGWQELFAPCSASTDTGRTYQAMTVIDSTSGTFVTAAGVVGSIHSIRVKNADGLTVDKAGAWTYNNNSTGRQAQRYYKLNH